MSEFVLTVLVVICCCAAVSVFIFTYFIKAFLGYRDRHVARLTEVLEDLLTTYLLEDGKDALAALEQIENTTRSKRNKNILINLLIQLNHNFSGTYSDKVFKLYHRRKLYRLSLAKLKKRRKYVKIRGMYELSTLEYDQAFDQIASYLSHSDSEVRRNVKISLIKLRKKEALMKLKDDEGALSLWTFINILATLKRNPIKLKSEELAALKTANNKYIRELSQELESTVYVK